MVALGLPTDRATFKRIQYFLRSITFAGSGNSIDLSIVTSPRIISRPAPAKRHLYWSFRSNVHKNVDRHELSTTVSPIESHKFHVISLIHKRCAARVTSRVLAIPRFVRADWFPPDGKASCHLSIGTPRERYLGRFTYSVHVSPLSMRRHLLRFSKLALKYLTPRFIMEDINLSIHRYVSTFINIVYR